jgi:transposase
MAKALQVELNEKAKAELEEIRDTAPQAYMRERAATILKVAGGMSCYAVACKGLLKTRQYQTVTEWVKRYKKDGVAGLDIRPGRGRKPAFFPSAQNRTSG